MKRIKTATNSWTGLTLKHSSHLSVTTYMRYKKKRREDGKERINTPNGKMRHEMTLTKLVIALVT